MCRTTSERKFTFQVPDPSPVTSPTVDHLTSGFIVCLDITARTWLTFHFMRSDYGGSPGSSYVAEREQFQVEYENERYVRLMFRQFLDCPCATRDAMAMGDFLELNVSDTTSTLNLGPGMFIKDCSTILA